MQLKQYFPISKTAKKFRQSAKPACHGSTIKYSLHNPCNKTSYFCYKVSLRLINYVCVAVRENFLKLMSSSTKTTTVSFKCHHKF